MIRLLSRTVLVPTVLVPTVLAALSCALGQGAMHVPTASFASLTVTPAGAQTFDLATGVTTLSEGGEIVDAERGIRVRSGFIRYLEGGFVEAADAVAEGSFGTLKAERVYFDLDALELRASGGLELQGHDLTLRAEELLIYLEAGALRLSGAVQSSDPDFEAAALIMKLNEPSVLLVAPYRYQSGALTLRQTQPGSLLQLSASALPDGGQRYSPSTRIHDEVLASLTPYLSH